MCVCVGACAIGRLSVGSGRVWKIPKGGSQSAGEEIEAQKKVVHKKVAVYLEEGVFAALVRFKQTL